MLFWLLYKKKDLKIFTLGKVEYLEIKDEYSEDELEDESKIDEQQSPEQTGKNIFKSYKVQ